MDIQEKYGFVYIWYDIKRKMYYIGSHWGHINDGYICSSNRMRDAYRRRPKDFKRRIIQKTNIRENLLIIEEQWLQKVKRKEKYYNLCYTTKNPWWHNIIKNKTIKQKISETLKYKYSLMSKDERKLKFNHSIGKSPVNKGVPWSSELREMYLKSLKGHKKQKMSSEHKEKISQNSKRLQAEGKIGMKGKKHSEETKIKMSGKVSPNIGRKHSEEAKEKIKKASTGRIHSEEAKEKISKSKKGKPFSGFGGNTPEVISKRAKTNTGKKRTPEQKEKMRKARLLFIERQKQENIDKCLDMISILD